MLCNFLFKSAEVVAKTVEGLSHRIAPTLRWFSRNCRKNALDILNPAAWKI